MIDLLSSEILSGKMGYTSFQLQFIYQINFEIISHLLHLSDLQPNDDLKPVANTVIR